MDSISNSDNEGSRSPRALSNDGDGEGGVDGEGTLMAVVEIGGGGGQRDIDGGGLGGHGYDGGGGGPKVGEPEGTMVKMDLMIEVGEGGGARGKVAWRDGAGGKGKHEQ